VADPVHVTDDLLRSWPLPSGEDKESRGRVLVVGGSDRTPGAVLLSAEAALRAGAGKVQIVTTPGVAVPCAVALPEALVASGRAVHGDLSAAAATTAAELGLDADCILVGPGLDDPDRAAALVEALLPRLSSWTGVLVLDALALAYVTGHQEPLTDGQRSVVLTPNLSELALTAHVDQDEAARSTPQVAGQLASTTGAVVSCGGPTSWTVQPADGAGHGGRIGQDERIWRDDSGHEGLGTAGSGDVLAGVVAGIAARCGDAAQAAVWAARLQGCAGERLARSTGPTGFLAREVAAEIPHVLAGFAR
jgi:hydroxyethylthiazole kinase-like uncharacterized protein yjeF